MSYTFSCNQTPALDAIPFQDPRAFNQNYGSPTYYSSQPQGDTRYIHDPYYIGSISSKWPASADEIQSTQTLLNCPTCTPVTEYSFLPPPQRRRVRIDNACKSCRRRKTKCDGINPCSACEQIDSKCEYNAPIVHHKSPQEQIDQIQSLLKSLQEQVHQTQTHQHMYQTQTTQQAQQTRIDQIESTEQAQQIFDQVASITHEKITESDICKQENTSSSPSASSFSLSQSDKLRQQYDSGLQNTETPRQTCVEEMQAAQQALQTRFEVMRASQEALQTQFEAMRATQQALQTQFEEMRATQQAQQTQSEETRAIQQTQCDGGMINLYRAVRQPMNFLVEKPEAPFSCQSIQLDER